MAQRREAVGGLLGLRLPHGEVVLLHLEVPIDEVLAAGTVRLVPAEGMLHDLLRTAFLPLDHRTLPVTVVSVATPLAVLMEGATTEVFADGTASDEDAGSVLLEDLVKSQSHETARGRPRTPCPRSCGSRCEDTSS